MSVLKKLYHIVALLAILHAVLLIGTVAYLAVSGRLTVDSAKAMATILEPPKPQAEPQEKSKLKAETDVGPAAEAPARDLLDEEMHRRNLERITMQAEDRLTLANRQMLEVKRRREELEQEQARLKSAEQQRVEESAEAGFQKELELLSSLKPKIALDNLLARPTDDAAQLLMRIDTRKATKIVEESAKDPRKWAAVLKIQERLRELTPTAEATQPARGEATEATP